ncbi:hypothetical protein EmuJ_000411500 [Echinococcus multilocularis]|uniref:Uncharacterized protein n=1 Tax=Echinococcus multilocularis TaxID=6211 RepID=A0A068XWX6_ECHMU|nr:hypothetical protein EmuJ_000411500 [Echinococcus multilocularis]
MGKGEKRNAVKGFFVHGINKGKKGKGPEIAILDRKNVSPGVDEESSERGEEGMASEESKYQAFNFLNEPLCNNATDNQVNLSHRPSCCNSSTLVDARGSYDVPKSLEEPNDQNSSTLVDARGGYDVPLGGHTYNNVDDPSSNLPKSPEKPNNQSPLITSLQTDKADFDDGIQKPVFFHRNPKQDAVLGELAQRLDKFKPISDNSPTSEAAPSEEASPRLLTKKPSKKSPTSAVAPSGEAAPSLPPKTFAMRPKPAVAPSPFHKPPDGDAPPLHREENNDIVRWLDFDPKHLGSKPSPLPAGRFLDCETWSGQLVVVPSEYARPISSTLELAQVLQRMPRARVIKDFVGTGDDDLSVGVASHKKRDTLTPPSPLMTSSPLLPLIWSTTAKMPPATQCSFIVMKVEEEEGEEEEEEGGGEEEEEAKRRSPQSV